MLGARKVGSFSALLVLMLTGIVGMVTTSILLPTLLPVPALSQDTQVFNSIFPGGSELPRGGAVISPTYKYLLWMQNDGNLVLYYRDVSRNHLVVIWASNTDGVAVEKAVMQNDGNFVLYKYNGQSVWACNTNGYPGAWLEVQEDGNVVIYVRSGSGGKRSIWATNTNR